MMNDDRRTSIRGARAWPFVLRRLAGAIATFVTIAAFVVGVGISSAAVAQVPVPRPTATEGASARIVKGWDESLREIDQLLVDGKPKKAYGRASRILEQASAQAISGDLVGRLLGVALVLKGIAAYGLERPDEALWLWYSALMVFPEAVDLALSAYGDAGPFLKEHSPRHLFGPPYSGKGVENPVKRFSPQPRFPEAQSQRNKGMVLVQTIIDESGRPVEPILMNNTGPISFVCATLDKLAEWRFKPAQKNGVPVPVKFILKVDFVW